MAYITESQLRLHSQQLKSFDVNLRASRAAAQVSIFLSHSHKDRELALGLKRLLASRGLTLYVDWEDAEMPPKPNRETAARIKKQIEGCALFLLLATANAMASRWVPWEVGVADSRKASDHIVIVPTIDDYGRFHGNEYLQMYNSLQVADSGRPAVFEPNKSMGTLVESFMRGF